MIDLYINEKKHTYSKKTIPQPQMDLISWMAEQTIFPKLYWQDRDETEARVAIGSLLEYNHIPVKISCQEEIRLYGGKAFEPNRQDALWKHFPSEFFFLPKYEIVQTPRETTLLIHMLYPSSSNPGNELIFDFPFIAHKKTPIAGREDLPDKSAWTEQVERCLSSIEQKKMQKAVLARKTSIFFEQDFSAYGLLTALLKGSNHATYFAFQMKGSPLFFGASPEKLFMRDKEEIRTEALAGTFPRGKSMQEDEKLRACLLDGEKEKRELQPVADFLKEALLPYCNSLTFEKNTTIFQTPSVQHLYRRCHGKLNASVSNSDLLDLLHPTPALGGMPREAALSHLQRHEPFYRGWYAGPIGWMSQTKANFCVGIRSALATSRQLDLFAGTGIVIGSDPTKEWEELEYKISQFMDLL